MKIKSVNSFFLLILAIGLLGCATSYKPSGFGGGYDEVQLSENVWKINFKGNGYTRSDRVFDFSLLRAAELNEQAGYPYFAIGGSQDTSTYGIYKTPVTAQTSYTGSSFGNMYSGTAHTTYSGGDSMPFSMPGRSIISYGFKKKPEDVFVYEASFIIKSIKTKYKIE